MLTLKNLFKYYCNGKVTKLKAIKLDNNFKIVFKNIIGSKYNICKIVYQITYKYRLIKIKKLDKLKYSIFNLQLVKLK